MQFKINKITYSKLQSRTTYDVSKNKPLFSVSIIQKTDQLKVARVVNIKLGFTD